MSLKAAINVSVLSEDPIFINRLKIFSQNININYEFIIYPRSALTSDLFLIDADLLEDFLNEEINRDTTKFMVRGKQKDLKSAFDAGCIDFLKTPCDMEEIEIRLNNVFHTTSGYLMWHELILNQYSISKGELSIDISLEEYTILKKLIQNIGEPVPREVFYYALWGKHKKGSRVIDMHISNLRKKIQFFRAKNKSCCGQIKTVRSFGYMIY